MLKINKKLAFNLKTVNFKNCKLVSRHLVIDFYTILTSLIPGRLANEQRIF